MNIRLPIPAKPNLALVTAALLGAGALPLQGQEVSCDPDNGGIVLPEGFCATVFADELGGARHLEVLSNGDVLVAIRDTRGPDRTVVTGGVIALRDTDGDGRADVQRRWGSVGGNEVILYGDYVYFAPNDQVLRYPFRLGELEPTGDPEVVVSDLPADRNHAAKSLAFDGSGNLFVNIGSPSNACMEQARTVGSPGMDPCPELETRAGIWRFDPTRTGQAQSDGVRWATGLRNVVALRAHPTSGTLFGVVHGRDALYEMFPEVFTLDDRVEKPSEEFVRIDRGTDFGWPYCYHDPATGQKVLAPEYGGDGSALGRCSEMDMPLVGFPAHWAPNDLDFYVHDAFPERYRGGAFIAFHGSWNRAPAPQAGYNVVFLPMDGDSPVGEWEIFAEGFAGDDVSPRGAAHRPVGVSVGPDGALYISDSQKGRIWRVVYTGS